MTDTTKNHNVLMALRVTAHGELEVAKAKLKACEASLANIDRLIEIQNATLGKTEEAPKTEEKKKETSKKSTKKEEPKATAADVLPDESEEKKNAYTLEDVQNALRKVMAHKGGGEEGKKFAVSFVTKYGAKKAGDLKPEQYELLIDSIEAEINGSAEDSSEDF